MRSVLRYSATPEITSQCYFATGRSCITHLIRKFDPDVVFLPGLCPDGVSDPFKGAGARSVFYHLSDDLAPDYVDVGTRLMEMRPKRLLFVLIHFFGYWMPTWPAAALAQQYGGVLFEDCAHCFPYTSGRETCGDVALYSFNKMFPVPDGALMLSTNKAIDLAEPVTERISPDAIEAYEEHLRCNRLLAAMPVPSNGIEAMMLLKTAERSTWAYDRYYDIISKDMEPKRSSTGVRFEGSRALGVPFDLEEEKERRKVHALALFARLRDDRKLRGDLPQFAFPIRVRNRDDTLNELDKRGVLASVLAHRWRFDTRGDFKETHLLLPLDGPLPDSCFEVINA